MNRPIPGLLRNSLAAGAVSLLLAVAWPNVVSAAVNTGTTPIALPAALVPIAAASAPVPPQNDPALKLWFAQPAGRWEEANPVGNGRMGAMVFGGIENERIQFNEDTLWTGLPHDYAHPTTKETLTRIQQLVLSGQGGQAGQLALQEFMSEPLRQKAFQPFGDLNFQFLGLGEATGYRRELDLESAIEHVSFSAGGVAYHRDVFASYPDQVIVVHLAASGPGHISFNMQMTSPHKIWQSKRLSDDTLQMTGQVVEPRLTYRTAPPPTTPNGSPGLTFESRIRVLHDGGTAKVSDDGIAVANADDVTLLLIGATSFKNFQDVTAVPAQRCASVLEKIAHKAYAAILADHEKDYRSLFDRVTLDLGHSAAANQPTDRRLRAGITRDPALAALYFQFGRYLLISSSRPGGQPANLQGVWNEKLDPPWESKYTTNINLEMNYWPSEVTNLTETNEPLWDLIGDLVISGERTAKEQYSARGWVLNHNTDLWRGTAPINGVDGIWPTGAAWLCHHMWEHYQFTGDKTFLSQRAYPAMKEASIFFMDYLIKDPNNGYLVTCPSFSPEHGGTCAGPAMDNQLIRSLMDETMASAKILGIDADFCKDLLVIRKQVAPDLVNKSGQLQEWLQDKTADLNHRHMSPLWALFPGNEMGNAYTQNDPKIFSGAMSLLSARGDGSTGWSYAWRVALWARAGDGDAAYNQFSQMIAKKTLSNMFDLCGPFQIDGNFGALAGIAEMLIQSHTHPVDKPDTWQIDLLPALPQAWPTGSVTGLCARGGFVVDMTWQAGRLTRAVIRSKLGNPVRIRNAKASFDSVLAKGGEIVLDGLLHPVK